MTWSCGTVVCPPPFLLHVGISRSILFLAVLLVTAHLELSQGWAAVVGESFPMSGGGDNVGAQKTVMPTWSPFSVEIPSLVLPLRSWSSIGSRAQESAQESDGEETGITLGQMAVGTFFQHLVLVQPPRWSASELLSGGWPGVVLSSVQMNHRSVPLGSGEVAPLFPMDGGRGAGSKREQVPLPGAIILFWSGLGGVAAVVVHREGLTRRRESGGASFPAPVRSDVRASRTIMFVSPAQPLANEFEELLTRAGYNCRTASSVDHVLTVVHHLPLALLVVDRRIQGWEMLRTDQQLSSVPIVILNPRGEEVSDEAIVGDLERGADGVYSYADGPRLLLAVVEAYCRRGGHGLVRRGVYHVGRLRLDADTHELTIAGKPVHLSAKQFTILHTFMSAPCRVFSRRELLDLVWGPGFMIGHHTLDVHIHALRRLLNRDASRCCAIVAIKGVGFKFKMLKPMDEVGSREEWEREEAAERESINVIRPSMRNQPMVASVDAQPALLKAPLTLLRRPIRHIRSRGLSQRPRRALSKRCRVG